MSINSLFNVSKLGIYSSQGALKVVSHNIANVNTDGYSKQTAKLETAIPNSHMVNIRGGHRGGDGVRVAEVTRGVDEMVESRLMVGEQEMGRLEARDRFLSLIEDVFNEMDGDGLSTRLEHFFQAADTVSDTPTNPVGREELVVKAEGVANFVNKMYTQLSDLTLPVDEEITVTLDDLNLRLQSLQEINETIMRQSGGPDTALDLKDRRQVMLNELNKTIDIEVVASEADGVRVFTKSGEPLMDATYVAEFSRGTVNPEHGFGSIKVNGRTFDFTEKLKSGELKGLVEIRDELLNGTEGFLARLEDLVDEVRYQFNNVHSQSVSTTLYTSQTGVFDLGSDLSNAKIGSLNTGADVPVSQPTAYGGTVTVGTVNTSEEHYPGAGTQIQMVYDATNNQFTVNENGASAAYSPVTAPTTWPNSASLRWLDVTFSQQPTDGDSFTFDVPQFDAPPDLKRVVSGEISFAYGPDTETLTPFSVSIDPSTMNVNEIVTAINTASTAAGSNLTAAVSNNKFTLTAGTSEVYGVVSDTSGVLGALGVGALFGGSGAQDMTVNSELVEDARKLGVSRIDATTPTAPVFADADNGGVLALSALRSTQVTLGNETADMVAHYAHAVGNLGSVKNLNDEAIISQETTQNYMRDVRDSFSGVSLEEEMTDMMKYQRAFQASSKMITVADELIGTIIQMVR
ncbi:MAG: flagellar hook-associated protein FlgK [Magnetococcales bacterium]|nr:flagellar hook-associated protein FlgK [Magnetococcales bacterium]